MANTLSIASLSSPPPPCKTRPSTIPTVPSLSYQIMSFTSGANANGSNVPASSSRPIAIVGMSCRFSGDVTSASKLWDLCASGRDGWTPIPPERFEAQAAKASFTGTALVYTIVR